MVYVFYVKRQCLTQSLILEMFVRDVLLSNFPNMKKFYCKSDSYVLNNSFEWQHFQYFNKLYFKICCRFIKKETSSIKAY